mgnify:CR=1 FL=1
MSLDDDRAMVERLTVALERDQNESWARRWLLGPLKATAWAIGITVGLWGLGVDPERAARVATGSWACMWVTFLAISIVMLPFVESAAQRLRGRP